MIGNLQTNKINARLLTASAKCMVPIEWMSSTPVSYTHLMLLCSVVMGVGTSVGGEKIIKSVGMDMVKLEKYQGFSADLSSSLCLLLATLTGIPVSTTHVKTTRCV